MGLYNDASLIAYPSGYKESKIYPQKPIDGSGDLTFARASSATRVNEQGLIENSEIIGNEEITNGDFATNLNSWSTSSWWVWNALGAYHPSSSAHYPLYQQCAVIGKQYTITFDLTIISGEAKFSFGSNTGSTTQVIADNLTTGSYSYLVTASAEYIIFNRSVGAAAEFYVDNVSVKEYADTNIPRIDYTNGCGQLLLEPQRTNLITESEDFSTWNKANTTVATNSVISPDGTINASKITDDTTSGNHYIRETNIFTVDGLTRYWTMYVKQGSARYCAFTLGSSFGNSIHIACFDMQSGVYTLEPIGKEDGYLTPIDMGNGWWRIGFYSNENDISYDNFTIGFSSDGTFSGCNYVGVGDYFYCWGAMLEEGSYPTSYIPTSGTTVTRIEDVSSTTGLSSVIGQTEGTFVLDFLYEEKKQDYGSVHLREDASNYFQLYISPTEVLSFFWVISGVTEALSSMLSLVDNTRYKFAIAYKANDLKVYINGVSVYTNTSITIANFSTLVLRESSNSWGQPINQTQLYKTRLTNTELATLTTL